MHALDERVDEIPEARLWLREVTNILLRWLGSSASAFNVNIAEVYSDLVNFGTAAMFIKPDIGPNMFVARPLTEIYLKENFDKQVDTVYRTVKLTARQAAQEWGDDAGANVIRMAREGGGKAMQMREYVHAVFPREDRDPDLPNAANMPFASVYVDVDGGAIVSEGGFTDMPYVTPRWRKYTGEIYGRGPGMVALPEALMLNSMQQAVLIAMETSVNPPLQIPHNSFLSPLKVQPGGFNYRAPGSTEKVEPLFVPHELNSAQFQIDKRAENIRQMFFGDLLGLPMMSRMTAEEVSQRRSDRMQLLSPVHFRLESELLSPVVRRTYNMLLRAGRLPELPEELRGEQFDVEYTSPLALAQRASESGNMQRAISMVAPYAQADPGVLQNYDTDYIARKVWNMHNNDPRGLRPEEEVESDRQRQAQQQQAAVDSENAVAASTAVRNASSVLGRVGG